MSLTIKLMNTIIIIQHTLIYVIICGNEGFHSELVSHIIKLSNTF